MLLVAGLVSPANKTGHGYTYMWTIMNTYEKFRSVCYESEV